MIKRDSHFGYTRDLGDDLYELKFNDGRRIYYTILPINKCYFIVGRM